MSFSILTVRDNVVLVGLDPDKETGSFSIYLTCVVHEDSKKRIELPSGISLNARLFRRIVAAALTAYEKEQEHV